MKNHSIIYCILIMFFASCLLCCNQSSDCDSQYVAEIQIDRDGIDTLFVKNVISCDSMTSIFLNKELDTVLIREFYKDSCVYSKGSCVSMVHFYQKMGEVFIPTVYLVPDTINSIKYDIYMSIIDIERVDTFKVGPLKILENDIASFQFNFEYGGDYIWYMDIYVDDKFNDYICYSRDSLYFSM